MKLFIGGINYETTETQITSLLAPFGNVGEVKVIMDRETGKSKGFAFAEMPDDAQASKAISALDQGMFGDRTVTVRQARPKKPMTQAPEMSLSGNN